MEHVQLSNININTFFIISYMGEYEMLKVIRKNNIPRLHGRNIKPSGLADLEYEYILYNKRGEIVKRGRSKADSYTLNFMKVMRLLMMSGVTESLTDTSGNSVSVADTDLGNANCMGAEADDKKGIVFGTGTTSFDITDSRLANQISHGDGDNLLHYYDTRVDNIDLSISGKVRLPISRNVVNNGSIIIDVREVGLILGITIGGTEYYFLIARDVLSEAISIEPGGSLKWIYYITTKY